MKNFLVIVISILLFSSCTDYSTMASIDGIVTDKFSDSPICGAAIELVPGPSTVTGADGTFKFEGLSENEYYITVRKDGYKFERKSITVTSGKRMEITIALEELSNE